MTLGNYYKACLPAVAYDECDCAVPEVVGIAKVGVNYVFYLNPQIVSTKTGYTMNLYVDAINSRTIEKYAASNSIGISGNTYATSESSSVLHSITNFVLVFPTGLAHRYTVGGDITGAFVATVHSSETGPIVFHEVTAFPSASRGIAQKYFWLQIASLERG